MSGNSDWEKLAGNSNWAEENDEMERKGEKELEQAIEKLDESEREVEKAREQLEEIAKRHKERLEKSNNDAGSNR